MFDIIVFESVCRVLTASTCKREPAFSNETSSLGTVFENLLFVVSENAVYVWTDVKGR